MINKIWAVFIIIGIIFSIVTNNIEIISTEIIKSCETSFNLIIKIFPVMALWLGIMKIAEESKLLNKISKLISPIMKKIFPEIPKNHESLSLITTNVVVNMFGLGNAATPIGLKAMKSLQEINTKKDTASRSMITFLILNTTGLTILPTTLISLKLMYGSVNPTELVLPCFLASFISTTSGIIIDKILSRKEKK
ncbi:MAG: spore maturation protein [Bacilli bacterium]|nr:spore maturation protein [Bacilli bacterium]